MCYVPTLHIFIHPWIYSINQSMIHQVQVVENKHASKQLNA